MSGQAGNPEDRFSHDTAHFQKTMHSTVWLAVYCAYVLCLNVSAESLIDHPLIEDIVPQGEVINSAEYIRDTERRYQKKRTITRAAKGLAVVENLLAGAKKVSTESKKYRLYTKKGDVETALYDFSSVNPRMETQTKRRKGPLITARTQQALVGTVGDRRLILMPKGDKFSRQSPVLEIRSFTDALHDRIVYKTAEK